MKVRELISALKKVDPELPIFGHIDDEALVPDKHLFQILEVDGVDTAEGERRRGDDRIATMKFGKGPASEKIAFINLSADF